MNAETLVAGVRSGMVKTMKATAQDEATHHNADYVFARPMPVPSTKRIYVPGQKWDADCSTGCRDVCWWTPGAPDPFVNGWAPWGNSSTIFFAMHHAVLSAAEPGDIYTFGFATGEHHACMHYGPGKVWNFGEDGQPIIDTLAAEIAYHKGMTVTLCKLPIVDPAPTPQQVLQAMTGFYAWAAWRLGEGPFKHWGEVNAKVRPHVPAKIPAEWWTHLHNFEDNRKKGNAK